MEVGLFMKIKTISIFICIILITSATCVPIFGSPNISQVNDISKDKLLSNENNDFEKDKEVKDIFSKIINDLANGNIDLEDMNQLYSIPYINQNIKDISNKETIELLDSIFKSESHNKIKFLSYKLLYKISKEINDESFSSYKTFFDEFFSEIKSVDDLKDSKYLSELNLKIDDIYQMKTDWELYISDKTDLKNIMKNLNINDNTSFLLFLSIVWIFVMGAAAINHPVVFSDVVILVEAVFFGIAAGAYVTDRLFSSDTHPILTGMYNFLNNSTILKRLPVIRNLSLLPIYIMFGLIASESPLIIAINGWLFITIFLFTFLFLHSNFVMFKFVTSGLWFIFPYIAVKILELTSDSGENTIKTSLFYPNGLI